MLLPGPGTGPTELSNTLTAKLEQTLALLLEQKGTKQCPGVLYQHKAQGCCDAVSLLSAHNGWQIAGGSSGASSSRSRAPAASCAHASVSRVISSQSCVSCYMLQTGLCFVLCFCALGLGCSFVWKFEAELGAIFRRLVLLLHFEAKFEGYLSALSTPRHAIV